VVVLWWWWWCCGGRYSHVHEVGVMLRLVFDLWVDDGGVGDARGVGPRGSGDHVMREPAAHTQHNAMHDIFM